MRLEEWFMQGLRVNPDGPALRIASTEWSYTRLWEIANDWADRLCNARDGVPNAVAIVARRSPESYAGLLAALVAGSTAVPVRPDYPSLRVAQMLASAEVDAIIADRAGMTLLEELDLAGCPVLAVPSETAPRAMPALERPRPDGDRAAYVLFTSGSTGRPKGVPISHANVSSFLRHNEGRYPLEPIDKVSQTFEQTFDLAMFDLFVAWGAGSCPVVVPPAAIRALGEFVERNELSLWCSVPSVISAARSMGRLPENSLPGLRWSLFCGEALTLENAAAWRAAAPNSSIDNLYGPTELTIACTEHRYGAASVTGAHLGLVPIGTAYPHLGVMIVDDEMRPVDEGELLVSGDQCFAGYLDPADTQGRLIDLDGRRWYRTGDRVRHNEFDQLVFLGRADAQIKRNGHPRLTHAADPARNNRPRSAPVNSPSSTTT